MNKNQLRRQFWLVLLIIGVGYLWWQSSAPDRYGELPSATKTVPEPPLPDMLRALADGNPLLTSSTDTLLYADSLSAARVKVIRTMAGDSCVVATEWTAGDSVVSSCRATLRLGYSPSRIELDRNAVSFRVSADTETLRTERTSKPRSAVAWPVQPGLLFEDLLLVQAPYWRGRGENVTSWMAVFTDRGVPLGMVKIEIRRANDHTIEFNTEYNQRARAEFNSGSVWVQLLHTPKGHKLYLVEHRGETP